MPKHFPTINPTVTVVAQDVLTPTGQRSLYQVNLLGNEVRETAPDGSFIVRRPVADRLLIDFEKVNEESLLAIVADRLADRSSGEFGNRRMDSALKMVSKALEAVRVDSTKPLRKRPQGEQPAATEGAEPEVLDAAPAIQIPGVTVGATATA